MTSRVRTGVVKPSLLEDWSTMQAYKTPEEGIKEVLKVCGAIPRGTSYFKDRFAFAEWQYNNHLQQAGKRTAP